MIPLAQLNRLNNCLVGSYKSILQGRSKWLNLQSCNYSRKSVEARLGLEKPKQPLNPYLKFMTELRPTLLAKNPDMTFKEITAKTSERWQELDIETKNQLRKEYKKDFEDYKKIRAIYESSLTDEQKQEIQQMKDELAASKEKLKFKAECKELGRPKKPMSSFLLYKKSHINGNYKSKEEYQQKVKEIAKGWLNLSSTEKAKFEKETQSLMEKYKKDLAQWELKMISLGREDLVHSKRLKEIKPKSIVKKE